VSGFDKQPAPRGLFCPSDFGAVLSFFAIGFGAWGQTMADPNRPPWTQLLRILSILYVIALFLAIAAASILLLALAFIANADPYHGSWLPLPLSVLSLTATYAIIMLLSWLFERYPPSSDG
jgi:uncharacterized BrkB/YihY/UPF0761 family membrane protein